MHLIELDYEVCFVWSEVAIIIVVLVLAGNRLRKRVVKAPKRAGPNRRRNLAAL